jgi:hypothetical protein
MHQMQVSKISQKSYLPNIERVTVGKFGNRKNARLFDCSEETYHKPGIDVTKQFPQWAVPVTQYGYQRLKPHFLDCDASLRHKNAAGNVPERLHFVSTN